MRWPVREGRVRLWESPLSVPSSPAPLATFGAGPRGSPLGRVGLKFGAAEYTSLMLLGLITATFLGQKSMLKSLAMVMLGLVRWFAGGAGNGPPGSPVLPMEFTKLEDGLGFIPLSWDFSGSPKFFSTWKKR